MMYGFPNCRIDGFALVIGGFLLLPLFLRHESRTYYPCWHTDLFRDYPGFLLFPSRRPHYYSATYAIAFSTQFVLHISKSHTAADWFHFSCSAADASHILSGDGWLSDRFEPRLVASVGMSMTTLLVWCF
jgi:hypothetical protein